MTRKVGLVVTARPSYARIKTALRAIQKHPDLELQLIVAASALLDRYGEVVKYIEADGFKVDARVYILLEGENLITSAKSTGLGIMELATIFDNLRPDVVVTVADRYETLATAVAASYMNIPVAHVQGGEITGSVDEKVRHAVTKLSNLHFVSTELAAERVVRMGEEESRVYVTGCPSVDLAAEVLKAPELSFDPFEKYGGVGSVSDLSDGYLVVMQHPVTTQFDESKQQIEQTLEAVEAADMPALWFWPNVDAGSDGISRGIRIFRERGRGKRFHYFKNMEPEDFLQLIYNSKALVGNSSVGIRESSFLGVPTVNIGERQSGRERGGNVIDVSHDAKAIQAAIETHIKHGHYASEHIYGDGKAGPRIADLLANAELTIAKQLTY
ncbi:MAG: UDP-N-acetylglucosamine 2-epimerase (hydrolyzing) [Chloroflexi bacterium]|nr:UDP-N-acetylglucosamine 2-epimerase (hydrolyzing) [Chloroflexota bacterium]